MVKVAGRFGRYGYRMVTGMLRAEGWWENGYNESFNGTLGEEVLKREIFYSLEEAKVLTGQWRREYNTIRPYSSLRYRPPAPEALRPDPFFLNLPKLNGPHPRLQEAVGLTQ